jgi:hypothetical protein
LLDNVLRYRNKSNPESIGSEVNTFRPEITQQPQQIAGVLRVGIAIGAHVGAHTLKWLLIYTQVALCSRPSIAGKKGVAFEPPGTGVEMQGMVPYFWLKYALLNKK